MENLIRTVEYCNLNSKDRIWLKCNEFRIPNPNWPNSKQIKASNVPVLNRQKLVRMTNSSAFTKFPLLHHFRSMRGLKQYNLTSTSSTMTKTLDRREYESTYVSFEEDDTLFGNKFEPYTNRRATQRHATQRTVAAFEKVVARFFFLENWRNSPSDVPDSS